MRKTLATLLLVLLSNGGSASTSVAQLEGRASLAVVAAVLIPFLASVLIFVFYQRLGDFSAYLGSFAGFISLLSVFSLFGVKGVVSFPWVPSLGVAFEFYVDGLSLLVGTLASGIGVLVFLYSRKYMEHGEWKRKYYTVLTAFMGSMIGLVFSSNLIMMFLFWELTSVCSFLLISHHQRTKSGILASKKSLFITVGSGMLLLAGIVLLGSSLGTFSLAELLAMNEVSASLASQGMYFPVLLLVGIGAAAKSAQVPLHIWLPDAMEAPTPVSAFLHSATMVKAGVFLLGRMRPLLMESQLWNYSFIALGLTTMTVAAVLAVASEELKELLAYSTASHLGLIVAGLGFSSVLGGETAVFHVLNHAVFKASLFMVAGIILHEAGTQKISELSGLRHQWPILAMIGTVSAFSMAGLPPLNGFFSKELLFESAYHVASHSGGLTWILPGMAVFGSIFTFIYSLRFVSVFYGEDSMELHGIPNTMLVPPGLLALFVVAIGLVPNQFIDFLVQPALHSVSLEAHQMSVHLPKSLKPSFLMSVFVVGSGALAFGRIDSIHRFLNGFIQHRYLRANFHYQKALWTLDYFSDFLVNLTETSLLRTYATWVLLVASLSGLAGFAASGVLPETGFMVTNPVVLVLLTSVASVYAVVEAEEYISAVLTLSILGFMVSIYYLLMDAPDLVMTQLVVETLSLIIFLLVLDRLPELNKKVEFSRKARDILVSGFAGLAVFAAVIYSTMEKTPGKVARYYLEHAVPGSGGSNVVNVILVDFRGLDTLGEISVIAMAGLSVLMLFRMRGDEE
jgi:multicomponent Na+:H+ antiporter subunit A